MQRKSVLTIGMLLAVVCQVALGNYSITSTFDVDADGWEAVGDVYGTNYIASGGNPGGYVSAEDKSLSVNWYWNAPSKFHGDLGWAYGGTLSYDLRQTSTGTPFDAYDVLLEGDGLVLVFDTLYDPQTYWTAYSVLLDASAGWRVGSLSGPLATQADFQQVLGGVTDLEIRGEFIAGDDVGDLDNVLLVPEPATLVVLVASVALLLRRKPKSR